MADVVRAGHHRDVVPGVEQALAAPHPVPAHDGCFGGAGFAVHPALDLEQGIAGQHDHRFVQPTRFTQGGEHRFTLQPGQFGGQFGGSRQVDGFLVHVRFDHLGVDSGLTKGQQPGG